MEALLAELRGLSQLPERKRGCFSRGSQAFLHFHEDAGDLYVDVRLGSKFERLKVISRGEQAHRADLHRHPRDVLTPPYRRQSGWPSTRSSLSTSSMNPVMVPTGTEPSTCNVTVIPWRRPWILMLSPRREKR